MQSQEIIHIAGGPAYSEFRKEKLLGKLQTINKLIEDIHSEYIHIAWCEKKITENDKTTIEKILHYGPQSQILKFKDNAIITMPRPGTISPWASRATDIANHCGLSDIKRIERAVAVYIELKNETLLSENEKKALSAFLQDSSKSLEYKCDYTRLDVFKNASTCCTMNFVSITEFSI